MGTLRYKPPDLEEFREDEEDDGLQPGDLCMARYAEDGYLLLFLYSSQRLTR